MIEILLGMAGSLIVFTGIAGAYFLGVWSAKKEKAKPLADVKTEKEKSSKPTIEEQFANLMNYGVEDGQ